MGRLISCKYCGKVHEITYDCPKKPKPKYDAKKYKPKKYKPTKYNSFMSSSAWQKTRAFVKTRDYGLCRVCLSEGKLTYKVQCHHIIPTKELIEKDWLDTSNLICLCKEHHEDAEAGLISRKKLFDLTKETRE